MATQTKSRAMIFAAIGCGLAAVLVLCAALVMLAGIGKSSPSGGLLVGTNETEKSLSRQEQIKRLNEFSPVAVPPSASEVKIKYQQFQDEHFDGSFVLPQNEFAAFVAKLTPAPQKKQNEFLGEQVGAYRGRVWTEPQIRRVHVEYVSF